MEISSVLAPNASSRRSVAEEVLLFLLVFTVLRTAVNADFVYSIDGMLCSGIQHDSELQQHDCVRWCHHPCFVLSYRRLDCVDSAVSDLFRRQYVEGGRGFAFARR